MPWWWWAMIVGALALVTLAIVVDEPDRHTGPVLASGAVALLVVAAFAAAVTA